MKDPPHFLPGGSISPKVGTSNTSAKDRTKCGSNSGQKHLKPIFQNKHLLSKFT
jgi:hypothetical protein